MKQQTETRLRAIGNSWGLWAFLFAAFGMFCLTMGEQKIQHRMYRNQLRVTQQFSKVDQPPNQSSVIAKSDTPYEYRLTGLRWILATVAIVGLISTAICFVRPPSIN